MPEFTHCYNQGVSSPCSEPSSAQKMGAQVYSLKIKTWSSILVGVRQNRRGARKLVKEQIVKACLILLSLREMAVLAKTLWAVIARTVLLISICYSLISSIIEGIFYKNFLWSGQTCRRLLIGVLFYFLLLKQCCYFTSLIFETGFFPDNFSRQKLFSVLLICCFHCCSRQPMHKTILILPCQNLQWILYQEG